jgi:hypothetical protein
MSHHLGDVHGGKISPHSSRQPLSARRCLRWFDWPLRIESTGQGKRVLLMTYVCLATIQETLGTIHLW